MTQADRPLLRALAALLLILCAPTPTIAAQAAMLAHPVLDGPPPPMPPAVVARDGEGGITIRSTQLTAPLALDGRLDDGVYQTVLAVSDFIQQEPDTGTVATEKTEVWIFHDSTHIYFAARCWDSHPERDVNGDMRRDGEGFTTIESFMVTLDTFYDRRNGFMFGVNPLGGFVDSYITNERDSNRDWNTVWDSRVGRFEGGWTAEVAIPFKSLRYNPGVPVWGINMRRVVRWKNETSHLTAISPSLRGSGIFQFSEGATLVGIDLPPTGRNFEIKPYAISGIRTDRIANPPISRDFDRDAGFDVKYGLTRSLTADFTINTDFAQVEDDAQQVNLTRFSLLYPEKREFFLEGQGIFAVGGRSAGGGGDIPVLFFTRRIGLHNGRPVPIRAGARLSGKVGPYSIGALNIQTGDERTSGADATNFTVLRVKRDIFRRSSVGMLYTRRSVSLARTGPNQTFALDGVFSFFQDLHFNGYLARTTTPGLSTNPTSYRAQLDYSGDRYGLQLERLKVGEDFNPEVGFLRRTDYRRHVASARFSPRIRSIEGIRRMFWEASHDSFVNGNGQLETRVVEGAYRIELENGDRLDLEYGHIHEFLLRPFAIADNVTIPAGGHTYQEFRPSYNLGTPWLFSGTVGYEQGSFYTGHRKGAFYRAGRVEMTPQLSFYPGLSFNWIDLPEGTFTTRLATLSGIYTMTPRMFVGALVQYNSSTDTVSSNVRLRWEYQPGSELFVVYTEGRNTLPTGPDIDNRAIAVKFTRLFRF